MKHFLVLASAILALLACSPNTEHGGHDMKQMTSTSEDGRVVQTESLAVLEARVLPPFPGKDIAAAYFTLKSDGKANRLVSVESPISNAVEIHNHIEENGVMKMRRVDGVDIAANSSVEFKPGSYHIMMFKADLPDDMSEVELTLTFEKGSPVTLTVPVEGREMEDAHSGH